MLSCVVADTRFVYLYQLDALIKCPILSEACILNYLRKANLFICNCHGP
jgi:hypothetical protein